MSMLLRCRDLWCCCYVICCYAAEISGVVATLYVATLQISGVVATLYVGTLQRSLVLLLRCVQEGVGGHVNVPATSYVICG